MGEYEPDDSRVITGQSQERQERAQRQANPAAGASNQQQMSQDGRSQSMGGMSQSAQPDPSEPRQRGFVDQQTASEGGFDANEAAVANNPGRADMGQQEQFDSIGAGGNRGGGQWAGKIREHMVVIGADGATVGVVDHLDGDRIKLTRDSSSAGFEGGRHEGHHHYISCGLVADIEGDTVRLSATGANAYRMEEEENG